MLVDGKQIHGPEAKVYYALHKPLGVVSTVRDESGRPTVRDILKNVKLHLSGRPFRRFRRFAVVYKRWGISCTS